MTYNILDEEFIKSSIYKDFMNINKGYGNLKIRAYAAREALPVEGVHIIVSTKYLDNKIVFFDGYTDSSGMIERLELPAPISNDDNLVIPLATTYEIRAEDVKNFLNQILNVDIYNGICVVQNINFIPESEVENGS